QPGKRSPLRYEYDGMQLRIRLGKTYTRNQKYTLYIEYISKPDEYAAKNPGGSAAITEDKGLYFINPDGKDPYKPTEVWTQGETEANSVWFPTIDKPDQKTMEQISMTVPGKFTTLSNGRLISRKKNADGSRTDTWKMEHPNSPYLFMMAAGPFTIVKDHWKNIPVDYYVEKEYAPYAKAIFGRTPAMIEFYSTLLGVPYQWSKYDQVVARDYVSGAMENTTATLHGEFLYKTNRQLLDDDYRNESVIAHELFHHWFGDLVTCESWSNITLNESFADFSEMLWAEHAYGRDQADQHSYQAMQEYFRYAAGGSDHPLVDFYYKDKEDVFDAVSYQKGGRVLNMLRNYVGNEAFFKSLQYYLEQHKFHPAEAQELRLAFEHITGRDLNWFWNQWYYGEGYPKLDIRYDYDDAAHSVKVIVKQTQDGKIFKLPFTIDIYSGGQKTRHQVMMMDRADTFTYHYSMKPDLVNVDGDKVLLAQKDDHKTLDNYIYQFYHAPLYMDRREAIIACAKEQTRNDSAQKVMIAALKDNFYGLRSLAIQQLSLSHDAEKSAAIPVLRGMAENDPKSSVRANALKALIAFSPGSATDDLIYAGLKDSSYLVEATALAGLNKYHPGEAYTHAKSLEKSALSPLTATICDVLAKKGDPADFPYVALNFEKNGSFDKFSYINPYLSMLAKNVTDDKTVLHGIDQVKAFAAGIGPRYGMYVVSLLENFVK
ncbi:MAG TPA: M1 family metallopeptidase, partial [Chitinophagaceae bacterium]